ncbi:MAG: XdhC family protein [Pseudomonadota bacterium]
MSDPGKGTDQRAMRSAFDAAERWLKRDGQVVMATVVNTWGSAPVPIGGQMVIATDGDFQGSVSGGCVEGEVIAAAEDVAANGKPETLAFGVSDETAWGAGLPCGGEIAVYLEPVDRDAGLPIVSRATDALDRRSGLVISTDLGTGRKAVHARGDERVPDDIAPRFRSGKSSLVEKDGAKVFHQAILPPARVVVIGATHIAQLFCEMARLCAFEVIVVDPRTAFASAQRFPGVDLQAEWPQDALPEIGLDAYTALVVVAHVSHIDDEALKIGLRSDCLYVGALGSKRNHEKRTQRLTEAGFTADDIARIKCPIGLDIGAQTPAEIATAILAEVILSVRGTKAQTRLSEG